nr:hypothetical protein CFP56_03366 [Quercus suber]
MSHISFQLISWLPQQPTPQRSVVTSAALEAQQLTRLNERPASTVFPVSWLQRYVLIWTRRLSSKVWLDVQQRGREGQWCALGSRGMIKVREAIERGADQESGKIWADTPPSKPGDTSSS